MSPKPRPIVFRLPGQKPTIYRHFHRIAWLACALAFGVIVFGVQLATRGVGRWWGWFWMLVAVVCIATTRSATIYLGLVAVAFVLAAVLLVRRARTPRSRAGVYWGVIGVIAVGVSAMLVFGQQLLALVGKSPDLTGRTDIEEGQAA